MYCDLSLAEVRGKDYDIPAMPRHLRLVATIAKDMKRIDDPSEGEAAAEEISLIADGAADKDANSFVEDADGAADEDGNSFSADGDEDAELTD